ncbi:hypothetical protein CDD83_10571 [Cordyceps sp. RAO-2017]|nr:hypothetical protein CDD83_10571 [Cordyceps sp. RAO-2017]
MFKQYQWFRPSLAGRSYDFGDIYDEDKVLDGCRQNWPAIRGDQDSPYLEHVKRLGQGWPHLKGLSDFMETSATPMRWRDFFENPDGEGKIRTVRRRTGKVQEEQERRARKTKVWRLDYYDDGEPPDRRLCEQAGRLPALLGEDTEADGTEEGPRLRLFVVEDLSRSTIECLGSHFDTDPSFFRSHLVDSAWSNIRDFWRDPPNLFIASRRQSWFQLRFVIPRYFPSPKDYTDGAKEAETFNVFRRPDDDQNRSQWDKEAIVGITRSKASLWLRPVPDGQAENRHRTDIARLPAVAELPQLEASADDGGARRRGREQGLRTEILRRGFRPLGDGRVRLPLRREPIAGRGGERVGARVALVECRTPAAGSPAPDLRRVAGRVRLRQDAAEPDRAGGVEPGTLPH